MNENWLVINSLNGQAYDYLHGKREVGSFGRVNWCLSVSMQYYSNSYKRIRRKPRAEVQGGTMETTCNFGGDLGFLR